MATLLGGSRWNDDDEEFMTYDNTSELTPEELYEIFKEHYEKTVTPDLPEPWVPRSGPMGWICPVCGRGLSPYTSECPCSIKWEPTCGTGTGTAIPQLGVTICQDAPTPNLIEDKSRCNKCANEYRCSKTMDKEGTCLIYKRDLKDGGFYG